MESHEASQLVNCSMDALIDWSTPETVKHKTYDENCINNPFDILELQAANMDPFDLVPKQTPLRGDPPCGNILSPLWESKVNRRIKKSVSLTDIHGVAKLLEQNYIEHNTDGFIKNQSKDDCAIAERISTSKMIDQSIENNILVHKGEKKIENEELSNKLGLLSDQIEIDIEKNSYCNEQEKKQIREQTRQRIEMLIEKEKKIYEENYSRRSLFCTPQRSNTESNLNKNINSSVLNRGFIGSFNINSNSFNKTSDNNIDINENITPNSSLVFPFHELNSFDLNSLKPEWVMDNFSDSDGPSDIQTESSMTEIEPTDNNQVDFKLKTLNRLGIVESKVNGSRTVLKSMQNKRTQSKGPFMANVPVQHMVQNYKNVEIKDINHGSVSPRKMKPIASSTPSTSDIVTALKTPSTAESSIKSRNSLSRRSTANSVSPGTPLNVTKCIKKYSTNTTIVLSNKVNERNPELLRSFTLNKSKSESKIGIPKMNTTKISGLPVSKRFSMSYKGKENVKPQ
ncbi:protein PF14_0175-like [Melanaphis sacchari]|uniref:protein PF14_0175-like n=1 Tax=Melanaphis sacchari TaxID=742174 RepID=UPI000DC13637|nr:protein PF14_0175-like [Melanaphis sacchari]